MYIVTRSNGCVTNQKWQNIFPRSGHLLSCSRLFDVQFSAIVYIYTVTPLRKIGKKILPKLDLNLFSFIACSVKGWIYFEWWIDTFAFIFSFPQITAAQFSARKQSWQRHRPVVIIVHSLRITISTEIDFTFSSPSIKISNVTNDAAPRPHGWPSQSVIESRH